MRVFYIISPESDSTIQIFEDLPFSELIKNRLDYFNQMVAFVRNFQAVPLVGAPVEQREIATPQETSSQATLSVKLPTNPE